MGGHPGRLPAWAWRAQSTERPGRLPAWPARPPSTGLPSRLPASAEPRSMKALLAKDLLILRRSRLLVGVLIVYPVAIALLIGLAISRSPGKPKVAIVDQTPPGETVQVGSQRVPVSAYADEIFSQVQPVHVGSRSKAVKQLESGKVLAAVVIPPNVAARLGTGLRQAQLEVLYNGNALEQSLVHAQIESALAQANIGFSEQIQRAAAQAIEALLHGHN